MTIVSHPDAQITDRQRRFHQLIFDRGEKARPHSAALAGICRWFGLPDACENW
jgi:hypothetical protein